MATYSGGFDNSGYTLYLDVSESNVSTTNNTSVVNWTLRIVSTKALTYGSWDGYGTPYSVKIDGSTVASGSKTYDFRNYQNLTVASGSKTITHNSDGSKTVPCSASFGDSSTPIGDASASGNFTLTKIPRASSVSGGSGNIGENTTINISRASSSFTHTLEYSFGSLTGTIATGVGTSYTWTIPTTFYAQIPNSNSGTGTITCKTYNGSTLIGTKTTSFTAKVTNSNPTVGSFTYKDNNAFTTNITENNQRIIRENSQLLFTVGTATAKNSASISKYEITFNERTLSRTSAGDLDFGIINLSSNATAILKVIDSRGNTATKNIEVIIDDWKLPTGLISLNRKNNFYSETLLKVDGTYSSLNGKNSMSIQYQYRKVTDKNFSELYDLEDNVETTVDLDNNYQWHLIVIVGDRIGETTYNLSLDRGIPLIFFDRLNENVGINCFPNGEFKLDVDGNANGKNLPVATGYNSLSDFDKVGAGEYLYKSGFYSANVDNVWYNLINVRHRNGYTDGTNYGFQIRSKFALGSPLEFRQQNNGVWTNWTKIVSKETIFTGELYGGKSAKLSNVKRYLDVYFIMDFAVGQGMGKYTIDTSNPDPLMYSSGVIMAFDGTSGLEYYVSESLFDKNTNTLTHTRTGFFNISTGVYNNRNDYLGYFIYQIDTYD